MNYFLLVPAGLLLLGPGCSKKNEAPANGFAVDGRRVVATTSSVKTGLTLNAGGDIRDYLRVDLISKSNSGAFEIAQMVYTKALGTPESAYEPLTLRYAANTNSTVEYSYKLKATLTKTNTGYSGTFAAGSASVGGSSISQGTFTNVQ